MKYIFKLSDNMKSIFNKSIIHIFIEKCNQIICLLFLTIVIYGCNNTPVTNNPPSATSDVNKRLLEIFVNTRCTVCPPADHYADNVNNLAGITLNDTNVSRNNIK